MKFYSLVVFFVICGSLLFAQNDTLFYSVVNKGKITGEQKVWQRNAHEYLYTYRFNDRGRGDSMVTLVHTNNDGMIVSLEAAGVDYYKNPYRENFLITGDSAVWMVNGERKAKKFENEFYSGTTAPALIELVLRWIVKQSNKRSAVLPAGFIHTGEPVSESISLNGKPLQLKLVTLYFEPSPSPAYVWMTEDLRFFAEVDSWTSHIRKGYEPWVDTLLTLQEMASRGYYEREVKNNSTQLAAHIVLTHANIFRSETATVERDMTVEVVRGKITEISPSSSGSAANADTVIDCKGKFLMPGLWEMHGHYSKDEGPFYLAGGVTHVRDMGNDKILLTYKKQIAENTLLGPDISYLSGFIDKEDPFQGPTGKIITSLDEGIKAIDEYHRLGYPQIKLYSAIKPAWVAPMSAHIHSLGMRLCGHIPAFMTAEQAINDGYDEITHMNFVFLNFMGDTIDTRTPARFRRVGDEAGKLNLKSPEVNRFISLMKKKNVALDATLNVWQGMFDEFKGDTSNFLKPIVGWLPQDWLANLSIKAPFGSEANRVQYKSAFSNMLKMQKMLYDNGILLVPGTDGGEANALHHELELYVQAGIPANQVLKIATYNAALDCNLQDTWGEIQRGRDADVILIDGDPTVNISSIRRVEWVIKNNRLYQPKQLLSSRGWKYYY
jgi:hypothetical protein